MTASYLFKGSDKYSQGAFYLEHYQELIHKNNFVSGNNAREKQ